MQHVFLVIITAITIAVGPIEGQNASALDLTCINRPGEKTFNPVTQEKKIGVIVDPRDGQSYTTVKIGQQWWFSENVNFHTEDSWCYHEDSLNCETYGRLYTWEAAQKACPSGWELPERKTWQAFIQYLGGPETAGKKAKSASTWYQKGGGSNLNDFQAKAAGFRDAVNHSFYSLENRTSFWSRTTYDENQAYFYSLATGSSLMQESFYLKSSGFSVRCVKK